MFWELKVTVSFRQFKDGSFQYPHRMVWLTCKEMICYTPPRPPDQPWVQLSKDFERRKVIIFLPVNLKKYFVCSKEPSHEDGSFDYPQHMFWLRNKKNSVELRTLYLGAYNNNASSYLEALVRKQPLKTSTI